MTCIRIPNGIICVNPWGRLHVGNRYVYVSFHEYCGPSFYTMKNGEEVVYWPEDENDPVWPEFSKWLTKYDKLKEKRNEQKSKQFNEDSRDS